MRQNRTQPARVGIKTKDLFLIIYTTPTTEKPKYKSLKIKQKYVFLRQAATCPKNFAAFAATKKKNSKPMGKADVSPAKAEKKSRKDKNLFLIIHNTKSILRRNLHRSPIKSFISSCYNSYSNNSCKKQN